MGGWPYGILMLMVLLVSGPATAEVGGPTLSSLTLNPTTVTGGVPLLIIPEFGRPSALGTVTLTGPAPAGGLAIGLSSSNIALATVPASVTVAAGQTTAKFPIRTSPVACSTSVTITVSQKTPGPTPQTLPRPVTRTATLSVLPSTVLPPKATAGAPSAPAVKPTPLPGWQPADTWVRIGPVQTGGRTSLAVDVGRSLAVDVFAGNAGTGNPPRQVSTWVRVATASGDTVCYELVHPSEVWLIPGESYRLVRFQVDYPSSPPTKTTTDVSYTISAEVFYDCCPTSQFETNTANNQQVVTYTFPAGGTPQLMKVVGTDNIFKNNLYPVFSHLRCINCHGRTDGNSCRYHLFMWCGSKKDGHDENNNPCSLCHSAPLWTQAGAPTFWQFEGSKTGSYGTTFYGATKSPRDLCYTVKHTFIANSLQAFQAHISGDPRIQWGFNPTDPYQHVQQHPKIAEPAPGGYQIWQQNMLTWFNQGLPCPPFPSPPDPVVR